MFDEVMPFLIAGFIVWVCAFALIDAAIDALNWWLDRRATRQLIKRRGF